MDPSDAIVNSIMADSASGPAFASSTVNVALTFQASGEKTRRDGFNFRMQQRRSNQRIRDSANRLITPEKPKDNSENKELRPPPPKLLVRSTSTLKSHSHLSILPKN